MNSRWWVSVALAAAGYLCLIVTGYEVGNPGPYTRALLVAFALFCVPGWLLCHVFGLTDTRRFAETLSVKFTASLAVLLPALAYPFAAGATLDSFVPAYCVTLLILALAAFVVPARPRGETEVADEDAGRLVIMLVALLVLLLTASAWNLTRTGSIDRWWYLAYVRGYMESGAVGLGEPFFASGHVPARFGFNCWLTAMAVWAKLASVEPAWLYERASPLLLVPLAFSSALFFGRSLFGPGRCAWLLVLASGLYWASGSLMPVSARMPEDKLLALLVMAPVTTGAFLSGLRRPSHGRVGLMAAAAAAQATCHGLVYGLVLSVLVPFTLVALASKQVRLALAGPLLAVLLLAASFPAYQGVQARNQLRSDGATMSVPDHPVVRIHHARGRLIEFDNGLYMVRPQLLAHPVTLLSLACIPLAWWAPPLVRSYLLTATLLPLSIAFVPPLAMLAGAVILPWMVYRLLWVVPFTAWLALVTDRASGLVGAYRWVPVLILVSVAMPWTVRMLGGSPRPERLELATPTEGPFAEAMKALSRLDADAIVAAAPEISERIPALTGRRVLATSDRGTIVFTGDRELGERRLRARAAIMSGIWEPLPDVPAPTHILFEPGSAAALYCNNTLFHLAGFELCTFAPSAPAPGDTLTPARAESDGDVVVSLRDMLFDPDAALAAECSPPLDESARFLHWPRSGPWSPRHPHMFCVIKPRDSHAFRPRTLILDPILGRGVDEYMISVAAGMGGKLGWRQRTRTRSRHGQRQRYSLPDGEIETMTIKVFPEFLPFLKLDDLSLTLEGKGIGE